MKLFGHVFPALTEEQLAEAGRRLGHLSRLQIHPDRLAEVRRAAARSDRAFRLAMRVPVLPNF